MSLLRRLVVRVVLAVFPALTVAQLLLAIANRLPLTKRLRTRLVAKTQEAALATVTTATTTAVTAITTTVATRITKHRDKAPPCGTSA
ncbi:hypothetical protein D3C75_1167920 [compost metagenome]